MTKRQPVLTILNVMLNMLNKFGVLMLVLAMGAPHLSAQGYLLVRGRFPEGKASVFTLTSLQKDLIELVRQCAKDNTKSPYVFRMTQEQSAVLSKSAGFSPTLFAIVDSYRGDDGVELDMNVIIRFDENHFEVPHILLMHDKSAHDWEFNIMGWKKSPLLNVDPIKFKDGKCPQ
jgi:hypothetical protein